eukprot:2179438-Pyramimonas_sp.AAC.1
MGLNNSPPLVMCRFQYPTSVCDELCCRKGTELGCSNSGMYDGGRPCLTRGASRSPPSLLGAANASSSG